MLFFRLAWRTMANDPEHQPGEPAPRTGHYRLVNVFGSSTATRVHAHRGHPLPDAPRGFGWRLEHDAEASDDC
jgi:hypothetical protein